MTTILVPDPTPCDLVACGACGKTHIPNIALHCFAFHTFAATYVSCEVTSSSSHITDPSAPRWSGIFEHRFPAFPTIPSTIMVDEATTCHCVFPSARTDFRNARKIVLRLLPCFALEWLATLRARDAVASELAGAVPCVARESIISRVHVFEHAQLIPAAVAIVHSTAGHSCALGWPHMD